MLLLVVERSLQLAIHKMDENTQDLHELQNQVSDRHSSAMLEREAEFSAKDENLRGEWAAELFVIFPEFWFF